MHLAVVQLLILDTNYDFFKHKQTCYALILDGKKDVQPINTNVVLKLGPGSTLLFLALCYL